MFPHDKLDWHMSRLDKRLETKPDDAGTRLEYAWACLSKAWWHEGGEVWFNNALTQARRILQHDPANTGALVIAGTSLVGLGRLDPGARYLDEASRLSSDRADVHLGLAEMYRQQRDLHQAVREGEIACRLAEDSSTQTALVAAMGLPQSTVARLLTPLRDLNLVKGERQGQEVRLSVGDEIISSLVESVCDWLHPGEGRETA